MDMPSLIKIGLLWIAVVASALAVTHYSHVSRQTYGQLTAMQREANQLQVEYGRYLLEQSAVGSLQRLFGFLCRAGPAGYGLPDLLDSLDGTLFAADPGILSGLGFALG